MKYILNNKERSISIMIIKVTLNKLNYKIIIVIFVTTEFTI